MIDFIQKYFNIIEEYSLLGVAFMITFGFALGYSLNKSEKPYYCLKSDNIEYTKQIYLHCLERGINRQYCDDHAIKLTRNVKTCFKKENSTKIEGKVQSDD